MNKYVYKISPSSIIINRNIKCDEFHLPTTYTIDPNNHKKYKTLKYTLKFVINFLKNSLEIDDFNIITIRCKRMNDIYDICIDFTATIDKEFEIINPLFDSRDEHIKHFLEENVEHDAHFVVSRELIKEFEECEYLNF